MSKFSDRAVTLLVILLFLIWCGLFIFRASFIAIDGNRYFSLFEDAMISMRYAWNFSHGLGMVWNSGERVEGYTNLLMVLIMSVFNALFDKRIAPLGIQVFGVVTSLVSALVFKSIAQKIGQKEKIASEIDLRLISLAVFVGCLSYYPLLYWSLMGMETGLLTMLVAVSTMWALKIIELPRITDVGIFAFLSSLIFITRPDGIIIPVILLGYIVWELKSHYSNKFLVKIVGVCVFIIGSVICAQVGFRLVYYHSFLPNTYVLKVSGIPLKERLINGIFYIYPFIYTITVLLFFGITGLLNSFSKSKFILLVIPVVLIFYQIYVGGDPWDYWRILSPGIPFLLMLFFLESLPFMRDRIILTNQAHRSAPFYAQACISFLFVFALLNSKFLPEITFLVKPYSVDGYEKVTNTAITLKEILPEDASVGVFWAGYIPYYSGLRSIDFLGKADAYIANLPPDLSGSTGWGRMKYAPGHNKYDLDYSIKKSPPTYIQMDYWGNQSLGTWGKENYLSVSYKGVDLLLYKKSPNIDWSKLSNIP